VKAIQCKILCSNTDYSEIKCHIICKHGIIVTIKQSVMTKHRQEKKLVEVHFLEGPQADP